MPTNKKKHKVLLDGYMVKHARDKSLILKRNNLKERYFELQEKGLYYYDKMEGNLRGAIFLSSMTYVGDVETKYEISLFQIVHTVGDKKCILYIRAPDKAQRMIWVSTINSVCAQFFESWPVNKSFHPGLRKLDKQFCCCNKPSNDSGCKKITEHVRDGLKITSSEEKKGLHQDRVVEPIPDSKQNNDELSDSEDETHDYLYISATDNLEQYSWYHNTTKKNANAILAETKEAGLFLVRPSDTGNNCVLCVLVKYSSDKFEINNIYIKETDQLPILYHISTNRMFHSIPNLIDYYRENCIVNDVKLLKFPARDKNRDANTENIE